MAFSLRLCDPCDIIDTAGVAIEYNGSIGSLGLGPYNRGNFYVSPSSLARRVDQGSNDLAAWPSSTDTTIRVHVWFSLSTVASQDICYIDRTDAPDSQCLFRTTAGGKLEFAAGTTVTGTSSASQIVANELYELEALITISNTVGRLRVKLNGITISEMSQDNIDTQISNVTSTVASIRFNNTNLKVGHIIVWGDTSTFNESTDFFTSETVAIFGHTKHATNIGNHDQWSAVDGGTNKVQNVSFPWDNGSRIEETTTGQRQSFVGTRVPDDAISILGLIIRSMMSCRIDAENVGVFVRIGSTDYDPTSNIPGINNTAVRHAFAYINSPATSSPFTISEYNSMEMGCRRVASSNSDEVQCHLLCLQSAYTVSRSSLSLANNLAELTISDVGPTDDWTLDAGADKPTAVSTDDGDTSTISSGVVVNTEQEFLISGSVPTGSNITYLEVSVVSKRGSSETSNGGIITSIGVSETYVEGNLWPTSSGYSTYTDKFTKSPDGDSWKIEDLNNLRVKVKNPHPKDVIVTDINITVGYSPGSNRVYLVKIPLINDLIPSINV